MHFLKKSFSKLLVWGEARIQKGAWYFAPISVIWAGISSIKNALYDWGWISSFQIKVPIISVGNLVVGGTGKTPLVHLLASQFMHRKVAILSRKYGSYIDEPLLLQRRAPYVKVYVGKDRKVLALQAKNEGAEIIFLDDGFQYRKLQRDIDLVILSGEDPFGKGHFLPWGFLRDHPKRLNKADYIFTSGKELSLPSFSTIHLQYRIDQILGFQGNKINSLKGKKIALFCGIAKPKRFLKSIETMQVQIIHTLFLADHEKPTLEELKRFAILAKDKGAQIVLCTEKDYVKWMDHREEMAFLEKILPFCFVEISLSITKGKQLWEKLIEKIEQKIENMDAYVERS